MSADQLLRRSECPCCGAGVVVPTAGGVPPFIEHGPDRISGERCPRSGWPVRDAIDVEDDDRYDGYAPGWAASSLSAFITRGDNDV